jgi:hypothetical protein|tara:strand:+ start:9278 stop:10276 length:999 start_codon:yes stop_codon:yes gene_type:complete
MAITHYEKSGSRTGSITAKGGSVDIIYVVEGSSEDHEIYQYLVDELDNEHIGLPAKNISLAPIECDDQDKWLATVTFSNDDQENEKDKQDKRDLENYNRNAELSFSTEGGTAKTRETVESRQQWWNDTFGLMSSTVKQYFMPETERVIPFMTWTESHTFPANYTTWINLKNLSNMTASVNDRTFRTFEKGEVLFVGASGNWTGGTIKIDFKFVAEPNIKNIVTNILIPRVHYGDNVNQQAVDHDIITPIKRGHEMIEYETKKHYQEIVDGKVEKSGEHVFRVSVHQIYKYINFDSLGIPDAIVARTAYLTWRKQQIDEKRKNREIERNKPQV